MKNAIETMPCFLLGGKIILPKTTVVTPCALLKSRPATATTTNHSVTNASKAPARV